MASVNPAGVSKANSLISSGNFDQSAPWSFDAAAGNALLGPGGDNWARYGSAHLAIVPGTDPNTKAHYGYPFAKLQGGTLTLYRAAVAAIRQRASQQGEADIFSAAGRLMDKLDAKKENASAARAEMPMPNMNENHDQFMTRCMGDETMMQEYPDASQRTAVCERQMSQRGNAMADHPEKLNLQATATLAIEAKAPEGDGPAPLPRFEMLANTGAPMKLAGWKYPVVLDLAGVTIPSQQRPIRYGHDASQGVGHTENIAVSNGMMTASGVISRDTPAAKDIVTSSKNGFPWQASVGADVDQVEFVKQGQSVTVNGQQYEGPLNVVTKSTLGEISFVDLGADGNTKARVAAMAKDGEQDRISSTTVLADEFDTESTIRRVKLERERQKSINALVELYSSYKGADIDEIDRIQAEALRDGTSPKDVELALLRASRPLAPQIRRADLPTPKVLEASLCMAAGVSDEWLANRREYGEEVVTKAYPLRNRGLRGTIAAALESAGVRVPYGNRELYDTLLEHRHQRHVRAEGFSTINLPGILGNVANKILLQAFLAVDATYDTIADQADFSNFHTHSIYRLDMMGEFSRVPKDGELKHANLGQDSYTNKLETSGLTLTLTRQDIINDDLNAFRTLTQQLARKARISVEKALYTEVMEASDVFYTTGRGNRLTGALGITELAAAEAAMVSQADAGGDPIYASPQFVLVPPGLRSLADSLFLSELLQGATTSTRGQPAANPFRGRFRVVSSPFLSATSLAGNSATTWYLLANPLMLPAFQVAYLDGRREPTIETADAEFDTLGLAMRCYWDFGVSQLDYRGVVKSTAT